MSRVVIVCVGNSLAADDAVGPAVHERLSRLDLPADVRLELLGVGGLQLLEELRGEEALIVVDAVQLGAPPGTVHRLTWEELPQSRRPPVSAHGIGFREAIELGRRLYPERMPRQTLLVGVEGRCLEPFREMTAAVAAAVDEAVAEVLRQAGRVLGCELCESTSRG